MFINLHKCLKVITFYFIFLTVCKNTLIFHHKFLSFVSISCICCLLFRNHLSLFYFLLSLDLLNRCNSLLLNLRTFLCFCCNLLLSLSSLKLFTFYNLSLFSLNCLNFFTFCSLSLFSFNSFSSSLSLSYCFFSFSNFSLNLSILLSCSKFYRRRILLSKWVEYIILKLWLILKFQIKTRIVLRTSNRYLLRSCNT